MADVREVWKALFGKEIEDVGWSADQSCGKVVRFSVNVPGTARESETDGEYEEALQEMLRLWRCVRSVGRSYEAVQALKSLKVGVLN